MNGYRTQSAIRFRSPGIELSRVSRFRISEQEGQSSRAPSTSLLRQQAALWESHGFSDALILRGEVLIEAGAWAADHADDLTDVESDLLEESQYARLSAQRLETQARLVRGLAFIAAFIAIVATQWVYSSRQERQGLLLAKEKTEAKLAEVETAQEEAAAKAIAEARTRKVAGEAHRAAEEKWVLANQLLRKAEGRALAAHAHAAAERDTQLAILLALEATRTASPEYSHSVLTNVETASALYRALGHPGWNDLSQMELADAEYRPAWRSSDWRIVGPTPNGDVIVWDGATGSRLLVLEGHTDEVIHAAWDSNNARVATSSRDGTAIIWDARSGARLATLNGHTSWVHHSAWSSDDARIVTSSRDRTALVWDAATSERVLTLRGHGRGVTRASWSPDDAQITTIDSEEVGITWDAATGTKLSVESAEMDAVPPEPMRTDSAHLVTIQSGGSERVWIASSDALVRLACTRVQRNLTQAEWGRYVGQSVPYRQTCSEVPTGK